MAEILEKRPAVKSAFVVNAEKLKKPLRQFGREVAGFSSSPALQPEGARVVTAEFRKLAPKLRKLGLEVVINGTPMTLKPRFETTAIPFLSAEAAAGSSESPVDFDPAEAGLRLANQMKQTGGGAFTGSELQSLYGLSPANLHRRRKEHRILFWRDAKHEFHYPKWQFTAAGALVNGIQEVLRIFKSTDEWRLMRYFQTPRQQLDGKPPLELLREGKAGQVIGHAKLHEAENSW